MLRQISLQGRSLSDTAALHASRLSAAEAEICRVQGEAEAAVVEAASLRAVVEHQSKALVAESAANELLHEELRERDGLLCREKERSVRVSEEKVALQSSLQEARLSLGAAEAQQTDAASRLALQGTCRAVPVHELSTRCPTL